MNLHHRQDRLRIEFLLKTDSGYPEDMGVNKPWQPLGIPFDVTHIGHSTFFLYKSFFIFLAGQNICWKNGAKFLFF